MVKVLANGDIVPDDDPRVHAAASSARQTPRQVCHFRTADCQGVSIFKMRIFVIVT